MDYSGAVGQAAALLRDAFFAFAVRQRFRALIVTAARPTPPQTAAVVLRRLLGMTLIVFYGRSPHLVSVQKHSLAFEALYATASTSCTELTASQLRWRRGALCLYVLAADRAT